MLYQSHASVAIHFGESLCHCLDWNPDFPSIKILYNQLCTVDLCKVISSPEPNIVSLPLQETKIMHLYVLSSIVVLAVENQFMSLLDVRFVNTTFI